MSGSGPLLEVGRIAKAHGIRGEVTVVLTTGRVERLASGAVLHTRGGALQVVSSRPHQGGHLVAFAGIEDRNQAEALRGLVLSAEAIDDPDELWVHDLVGRAVVEANGTRRGLVTALEANPASDLLVLDSGALVPLTFVVDTTGDDLVVEVPEGLFDL